MPHAKKAGPNLERPKSKKTYHFNQPKIVNNGIWVVLNSGIVSEEAVSMVQNHYIPSGLPHMIFCQGVSDGISMYQAGYEQWVKRNSFIPLDDGIPIVEVRMPRHAGPSTNAIMREIPRMSVEQSHNLSRRMFARTAEDRAKELYDDAE